MRVLVTGAAGFIGMHVAQALLARGDSVIGIDKAAWQQELALHAELFKKLEYHLPAALPATKAQIEARLATV